MEISICPICGAENKNKMLHPFCSVKCTDKDAQNGGKFIAKYFGREEKRRITKCPICLKKVFRHIYCSLDCQRIATKNRDKSRRETIPESLRIVIFRKNEGNCVYCGERANCIDHVHPVVRGGRTIEDNLVPSCTQCNSTAGGKMFKDIEEKRKYILNKRGIDLYNFEHNSEDFQRPVWHKYVYGGKRHRQGTPE